MVVIIILKRVMRSSHIFKILKIFALLFDQPGLGLLGGHYFRIGCPYVHLSARTYASVRPSVTKQYTRMRENNENLLAVAWWVILNSLGLSYIFFHEALVLEQLHRR